MLINIALGLYFILLAPPPLRRGLLCRVKDNLQRDVSAFPPPPPLQYKTHRHFLSPLLPDGLRMFTFGQGTYIRLTTCQALFQTLHTHELT